MLKSKTIHNLLLLLVFPIIFCSTALAEDYKMFVAEMGCSTIGPQHPVETKASGEVLFQLTEGKQELTYRLEVKNIVDPYMAHLHVGPCDEEERSSQNKMEQGPIAAWLYPPKDFKDPDRLVKGEFTGVLSEGVITPRDLHNDITFAELIEAMRAGDAYANVHTRKYITCEICGRVKPKK